MQCDVGVSYIEVKNIIRKFTILRVFASTPSMFFY